MPRTYSKTESICTNGRPKKPELELKKNRLALERAQTKAAGMNPLAANQSAKSPQLQAKIEAGTHRMVKVRKYVQDIDFSVPGAITIVPYLDGNGEEVIESFSIWRVTKKERPLCGAKCRDGNTCKARSTIRTDGSFTGRCRRHGGSS